jgi:rhodanese-related sulfurtransferase
MPEVMISREELQKRVDQGAHLIEVLPAKEFARVHLPRAINIPLAEIREKTVERLDKKNTTIVHCYDYQ